MPVRRRALIAVLALVLLTAAPVSAPAAGAQRTATGVVVSLKVPAFHGTLRSAKNACKVGRTVRLYKIKTGPDKLLKTATSNDRGRWSTPVGKRISPGSYYVKAVARDGCRAGKSKTLTISG